jgi:hypothetical protein
MGDRRVGSGGRARGEIEVAASPQILWEVLTDIPKWPSWNPDVESASLEGRSPQEQSSAGSRAGDNHVDASEC